MNRKHRKTLEALFAHPVSANIKWRQIEGLLKALGAEIEEGEGSRIHVLLNGGAATFHRPHPRPDTDKGAVSDVRDFLAARGVRPLNVD